MDSLNLQIDSNITKDLDAIHQGQLSLFELGYNPDVLDCLSSLSNDEVFTSPKLANLMLDLLPSEIWSNPKATFLDPVCKSGVFLREIVKRLDKGLTNQIPDKQTHINHILKNQVFGIAITGLTALLSRRSVYCSKVANSSLSICEEFDNDMGNIIFGAAHHHFKDGKCSECGASQGVFGNRQGLENHAYAFIHSDRDDVFGELLTMKFDVIIGNPPYQLNVGNDGGNSSKAKAIYHLFIEQAIRLNPRYLVMITPSRWMTRSVEGIPPEWIDDMLKSTKFKVIHDFESSKECFPNLAQPIEGGVNYFLWDSNYNGKCEYNYHTTSGNVLSRFDLLDANKIGVVIRDPNSFKIIDKIKRIHKDYFLEEENNFSSLVSPKDFFTNKEFLTSKWKGFKKSPTDDFNIKYYLNKNVSSVGFGWVSQIQIPNNLASKDLHKVYIPAANGSNTLILGKPFYGEPNSVCSQTYLVIGYDPKKHFLTKEQCENIISYIQTKFFRYLVSIKKKTQNGARGVYQFVPLQNFNESWSDEKLYLKYGLSKDEINLIENTISSMDNDTGEKPKKSRGKKTAQSQLDLESYDE